jgi:hypothetical protein
MSGEDELHEDSVKRLLEQIKGLLILQLRNSKVDDSAIGNIIGTKAKSVRNRYPLTKTEKEEQQSGAPIASQPNQTPDEGAPQN